MVTYDEVVFFYKNKPNIVEYEPQGDDCQKLAKTFFLGFGLIDDCIFSYEIKRRMLAGTLTELCTFKYFTEEEAFNLVQSGFMPVIGRI